MNTIFQFTSTKFNCEVTRDYFLNPNCFGDDVTRWMLEELSRRGISTCSEPEQEDFGWYLVFEFDDLEYYMLIGFQPNDPSKGDCWIGEIEKNLGLLQSFFGKRKEGISGGVVSLINSILKSDPEIRDLRWVDR